MGARERLTRLADRVLLQKADPSFSFSHFKGQGADPQGAMRKLRESTLSDLLLEDGAQLGIEGDYEIEQRGLDNEIRTLSLSAIGADTYRAIEIKFWYKSGDVCQELSLSNDFTLCRQVIALEYAETGYEGHNQNCRAATVIEMNFILDLIYSQFALVGGDD